MWRAVLLLSVCLGAEPPLARAMLAGHNQVRARVGVPALIWSNKLEAVAQEWANRLIARREFGHRAGGEYGENLYAISGGRATEAMVIAAWAGESIDYDIKSNRCRDVCGHYTQMVWADTKRVGCAVARGGGREVWVCNYDPPGNWAGQRPYTVSAGTIASTEPGVHLDPIGVVNAASLAPSGAGPASSLPFPATSGGVRVEIDETAAPVYAVSPTQIIELIPLQTNGNTASFVAGNSGARSSDLSAPLAASAPGVFNGPPGRTVPAAERCCICFSPEPAPLLRRWTLPPLRCRLHLQPAVVHFKGLAPGLAGLTSLFSKMRRMAMPSPWRFKRQTLCIRWRIWPSNRLQSPRLRFRT